MTKYGIGKTELSYYDLKSGQPLLIVEEPDVTVDENKNVIFNDEEVARLVYDELDKIKRN